jgi:hypothetical protein
MLFATRRPAPSSGKTTGLPGVWFFVPALPRRALPLGRNHPGDPVLNIFLSRFFSVPRPFGRPGVAHLRFFASIRGCLVFVSPKNPHHYGSNFFLQLPAACRVLEFNAFPFNITEQGNGCAIVPMPKIQNRKIMKTKPSFIDLTQRPPRSFRVRLGNYVILARMLDKGRATLAKKNGEYNYNSGTDQHLVRFLGFDPEALLKELAAGKADGEILEWVQSHSKTPRAPWEIEAWSAFFERRGPDSDAETLELFAEYVGKFSKTREDIKTWFDAIELDDYVSFGGKA